MCEQVGLCIYIYFLSCYLVSFPTLCPILIYLFYHIILHYSLQACYDVLRRDRKEVALDGTGNHNLMHGRNNLFLIKGKKENLWK